MKKLITVIKNDNSSSIGIKLIYLSIFIYKYSSFICNHFLSDLSEVATVTTDKNLLNFF